MVMILFSVFLDSWRALSSVCTSSLLFAGLLAYNCDLLILSSSCCSLCFNSKENRAEEIQSSFRSFSVKSRKACVKMYCCLMYSGPVVATPHILGCHSELQALGS